MTTQMESVRVYTRTKNVGVKAGLMIGVGLVNFLFLGLRVMADVMTPLGKESAFGSITFPVFAAVGAICILYGVMLLASPVRVILEAEHLVIEGFVNRRRIPWRRIAELRREKSSVPLEKRKVDVLVLCDERGKKIADINGLIGSFPELVADIEARTTALRGAPTYDRAQDIERKLQQRRKQSPIIVVISILFIALAFVLAGVEIHDLIRERRLAREGVLGAAHIERHYMWNVTPRLEYSLDANGKHAKRDIAMEKEAWQRLEGEKSVPVRYLISDPGRSHLLDGEVPTEIGPPWTILLCGFVVLFFSGLLVLHLRGYDLDTKDGRLRIRKITDILEDDLETESTQPPPLPPAGEAPPIPAGPDAGVYAPPASIHAPLPRRIEPLPVGPVDVVLPAAGKREVPKGVIALVVLNLVLGSFGLLLNLGRLAFGLLLGGGKSQIGPIHVETSDQTWLLAIAGSEVVLCSLLLVSALGLYQLKAWGRIVALIAGAGQLLTSMGSIIVTAINFSQMSSNADSGMQAVTTAGMVGAIFFQLFGMIYPLVLLCVLGRSAAREQFT